MYFTIESSMEKISGFISSIDKDLVVVNTGTSLLHGKPENFPPHAKAGDYVTGFVHSYEGLRVISMKSITPVNSYISI